MAARLAAPSRAKVAATTHTLARMLATSGTTWRAMSDSQPALAELGDSVKVHYKGSLEDGRIFHNTHKSTAGERERGCPVHV